MAIAAYHVRGFKVWYSAPGPLDQELPKSQRRLTLRIWTPPEKQGLIGNCGEEGLACIRYPASEWALSGRATWESGVTKRKRLRAAGVKLP